MLLRYAKLAGGLRLLIATAAPLVVTTASLLSARTAAYVVGFGLGSILSIWLPIVLTLVSLTGAFGGSTDTSICDAYRAELKRIEEANAIKIAECERLYKAYAPVAQAYSEAYTAYSKAFYEANQGVCDEICASDICPPDADRDSACGFLCYGCMQDVGYRHNAGAPVAPEPPTCQKLEYWGYNDGCGSETPPDCPEGKKVWLQVLWASPGGKASDAKGCFIVAYSQDSRDLPPNIEYNPFLPESFVRQQALNYDNITGNKLAGADSTVWKDLDSSSGWDKGYWVAESTDTECRGWRPGWSLKVK